MADDYIKVKDIKPVLYGYVRDARNILDPEVVPDSKKVHDLRVLMKKARAVMKLISPQIDASVFEREYSAFRETGRISRLWRETAVHRKTLKELKRRYPDVFARLSGHVMLDSLMKKPVPENINSQAAKEDMGRIAEILEKSGYRIRFIPMDKPEKLKLIIRLAETYSEVSAIYLKARHYPKSVNLHELRKKAKDLLYQLYFFRETNDEALRSLEKRLSSMSDYLGKYHDLAVLLEALDYKYCKINNDSSLDELAIIIRHEQDRFLSKIWPQAYRLFAPGKEIYNVLGFRILRI